MAVNRVTVTLEQPEYSGLLEVAIQELRDPRDQLRHILRLELERRGLLADCSGSVRENEDGAP
jgi:hypothetical protein